jgi:replicative DNA helicase
VTHKKLPPPEERELPKNLEAERSVLGAILMHNGVYTQVADLLQPADFFRDAHRRLYASMRRLLDRPDGAVDLVTLKEDLGARGELEKIGGPVYVTGLVDGLPRGVNVKHYAGIIKAKALLRGLIRCANDLQAEAYAAEAPADELLLKADQQLLELQKGGGGRLVPLQESWPALVENLDYRAAHKGELTGVTTGFPSIDEMTSGWQPGDVVVIAARPSIGKTTLVLNMATAAALAGQGVGVFSMEMRRRQLELRMLSSLSGIPLTRLQGGRLFGDAEHELQSQALGTMHALPLYIDDTRARTVPDVRAACRRIKSEHDLRLVVIDYFQLMGSSLDRRGATRNEELADSSRRLTVLAGELEVPILLLSQLNRRADDRPDPKPKLSDLRECGALEQDADIVSFLHRKNHREGGVTNYIFEKQRDGPTGTVNVTLDRDIVTFTDGGEELQPTAEEKQTERKAQQRKFFQRRAHAS